MRMPKNNNNNNDRLNVEQQPFSFFFCSFMGICWLLTWLLPKVCPNKNSSPSLRPLPMTKSLPLQSCVTSRHNSLAGWDKLQLHGWLPGQRRLTSIKTKKQRTKITLITENDAIRTHTTSASVLCSDYCSNSTTFIWLKGVLKYDAK